MLPQCYRHHGCDCLFLRLALLEVTLRRLDSQFGNTTIVVNGLGEVSVRKWLNLDRILKVEELS